MPRPGPRPYECVRRAWHSDRHQPIRGSLIQEMFRIANEVHSPATRKNKEWQEKLPVVVLKAEEIMYSKANSEAEYSDLKTLWDRANDSINTIIRREDDSPESLDLLQPCIEAALNLGCIPRRASRSQRHSNQGFYLSSTIKEPIAPSPKIPDNSTASPTHLLPSHPQTCSSSFATPITTSASLAFDTSHEYTNSLPFAHNDLPLLSRQDATMPVPMMTCTSSNMGRVYPLYYTSSQPKTSSRLALQNPQDSASVTAATALRCVPSADEFQTCCPINFLDRNTNNVASNRNLSFGESYEHPPNSQYDLSLRLGPPSHPCLGSECAWTLAVEDVGSSSSCDNPTQVRGAQRDKVHFLLMLPSFDRKQITHVDVSSGDANICWNQKISRDQLLRRKGAPGL